MLSSTEAWYGVTKEDVKKLEKVDIYYHQSVLSQVPHEMVYLELGVLPIIYISMLRKVLYLQQILKQENENSHLIPILQSSNEQFKVRRLGNSNHEIFWRNWNKNLFRGNLIWIRNFFIEIAKTAITIKSLNDLTKLKEITDDRKLMIEHLKYTKLEMSDYLNENEMEMTIE